MSAVRLTVVPDPPPVAGRLLPASVLADQWGVSERSLRNWRADGLPHVVLSWRRDGEPARIAYPETACTQWLASRQRPAA